MINTTLTYIESCGKYLMLHRDRDIADENYGKWIGVGGKFKDGESPEECAVREIREETGLSVQKLSYRGIVTFVNGEYSELMHLFTCKEYSGTVGECDEGTLEWVNKNEILSLDLWEGDRIFLDLLGRRTSFFSLKLVYNGDELISAVLDMEDIDPGSYGKEITAEASDTIKIYTDGSCKINPGPGGWAAVIAYDGHENVISGGEHDTTNNRMEMKAVINAVSTIPESEKRLIEITTDSQYVLNGIEKGWAKGWKAKNWTKADGKPALNPDLWEILLDLCDRYSIRFLWTKGHAGHEYNERCDKLAQEEAEKLR